MRTKLNLDLISLDRFTILLHGGPSVGKTHLMGDALATYKEAGGKVRFLNIKGEDGFSTVAGMGLGDIAETVESVKDFEEAISEYKREGLAALGIDGGPVFYRQIMQSIAGDRLPRVGGNSNEWGEIHFKGTKLLTDLHYVAPVVMMSALTDLSMDQITGETKRTPDFPGRMAAGIAGLFDFVFYMETQITGPTSMKRILYLQPILKTIIRARSPRPLPASLEIPVGRGGWTLLYETLQKSYQPLTQEK